MTQLLDESIDIVGRLLCHEANLWRRRLPLPVINGPNPSTNLPFGPMSGGNVVTIGTFDGVHLGHQALVQRARTLAGDDGQVIVRFFDPHPLARLRPDAEPPRITTASQRVALLHEFGADSVICMDPTPELLAMTPDEFIAMIVDEDGPANMVEGPDFQFGKARAGTLDVLDMLADTHGFALDVVPPVIAVLSDHHEVTASSSMVRWLLSLGRVHDAGRLLARPYRISGDVRTGDKRGRTIGVPTANVESDNMLPGNGVYAGLARREGEDECYAAAINIGTRPTFHRDPVPTLEVHLLEYEGPLDDYGWRIEVDVLHFLREELRFSGIDAIKAQIQRDLERTRELVNPDGSGD